MTSRSRSAASSPGSPASSYARGRRGVSRCAACRRRQREEPVAVEIRGHDLVESSRIAQDVKTLMDSTPGIADSRVGREEGRPEIAVRVDRDKAAIFGMTVTGVANTIRTNLAGTQAAMFREAGNEYPISYGCARKTGTIRRRSGTS